MLESLVAGVLNRTLGSYLENFDPNQLKIGIWSGDVKLKNLKLKKESLDKLNLPIELNCGHVGELTLQIPWSNLKGQPVKILVEDVYILAAGRLPESINIEEDIQRELNAKRQRLESLEVIQAQKTQLDADEKAKNESFIDSLTTKIIDNLQVTIKNIHVRYEDEDAFSKYPYAVGATLQELSAVSTNGEWVPSFIESVSDVSRKLVTLNALEIYWDTEHPDSIYCDDESLVLQRMQDIVTTNSNHNDEVEYLVEPVSGGARVTVNKLGPQENHAHYEVDLNFEKFNVDLNSLQYRDILDTISRINWYQKTYKFKKFRPTVPVEEDPKKWLKYAFECVYDEIHQRNYKSTWEYMAKRRDQRKLYVKLWLKRITDINSLTEENKSDINMLERQCDYDDLKFYRSLARIQYKKSHPAGTNTQTQAQQKGWFSSWWAGDKEVKDSEVSDDLQITEEQKNEFYNVIEFDESKALTESLEMPRDRVKVAVGCKLDTGSFTIKSHHKSNSIAEFISNGCHVDFFQRKDSFYVGFKLNEFKVEDGSDNTLYKHIVSVKPLQNQINDHLEEAKNEFNEPFFQVSYEQNPLDETADSELLAKLTSMSIFHNPKFLGSIVKFFTPPKAHEDTFGTLVTAAESKLSDLTKLTRIGIQSAFENHKTLNCKMDLQAPLIIFPVDSNEWNSPVGILDAGHISILSDLVDKDNIEKIRKEKKDTYTDKDWDNIGEYMYDKFKLVLQDAQILIGPDIRSTIEQLHSSGEKPALILDHLNMNFLIETSIIPSLPEFPRVKVSGDVPKFKAMLNDYQYRTFMDLVNSDFIQLPSTGEEDELTQHLSDRASSKNSDIRSYGLADSSDDETYKSNNSQAVEDSIHEEQHQIELNFNMDLLVISLKRCYKPETYESDDLVDLIGEDFKLKFFSTSKNMHVDLRLADLSIDDFIENSDIDEFKKLICHQPNNKGKDDLFVLDFTRSLRIVPFENEMIECYDQNININISDFQAVLSRKSLLTLLNYSLNTFTDPMAPELPSDKLRHNDEAQLSNAPEHINLNLTLKSFNLLLNDYGEKLATLKLENANVSLFLLPDSMKLSSKIGGFSLIDNFRGSPQKLISIQGDDLCDFYYETYDAQTNTKLYDSEFRFESKSMIVWFMEDSFNRLYSFLNQFQQMKYIYDRARDVALDQANNVEYPSNTKLNIVVRAPIIVFPKVLDPAAGKYDSITVNLGEIHVQNDFVKKEEATLNLMSAILLNSKISSSFHLPDGSIQKLDIIDQLDVEVDIDSCNGNCADRPDIIVRGRISGKEVLLTEWQLFTILQISKCFPRTFNASDVDHEELEELENDANDANMMIRNKAINSSVDTEPNNGTKNNSTSIVEEVITKQSSSSSSQIDISLNVPFFSMTLFDNTKTVLDVCDKKLTKFSLNDIGLSVTLSKDGTHVSDLHIKSFVIDDLRSEGKNRFTSIMPDVDYEDNQFMAKSYSCIEEEKVITNVELVIDSPKVLLAMDYFFALKAFFDIATYEPISPIELERNHFKTIDQTLEEESHNSVEKATGASLLRLNLKVFNPSIFLLADSEVEDTEAIVFKIGDLFVNNSNITDIEINEIGMFLCKMNSYDIASRLRLIDDFSLKFKLDPSGCDENTFVTSINSNIEPLLLRLSLRDIKLAIEIFNRASLMYTEAQKLVQNADQRPQSANSLGDDISKKLSKYAPSMISSLTSASKKLVNASSNVITKGERMCVTFEGFRMVLIGDIHELPILDFNVDPFSFKVNDWSTELSIDVQLSSYLNIFNYSSSSWEPLIQKWPLNIHAERGTDGKVVTDVISREKAELNVTSKAIATLSHFANLLGSNSELIPRGEDSPYRISNQTGYDINIWVSSNDFPTEERERLTLIKDSGTIPWSFEDWRQVRENLSVDNSTSKINIELIDSNYKILEGISLKTEGEEVVMLTPATTDEYHNRLACEIILREDNVKQVTIKSTIDVHNMTPTPICIGISSTTERTTVDREITISPSEKCALPIDFVYNGKFGIRPLTSIKAFGYSNAKFKGSAKAIDLTWNVLKDSDLFLECPNIDNDTNDGCYYFKAHAIYDRNEPLAKVYPHMSIQITPPMVIENLLPFDIVYHLFQKDQDGASGTLLKGEKVPLHIINMSKNTIMKIKAVNSKYELSQPAIIHAVASLSQVDKEIRLKSNEDGQRLNLQLNYSENDNDGFKISIYTPYLIVNRTGKTIRINDGSNTLISRSAIKDTSPIPDMFSSVLSGHSGFFRGSLEKNRVTFCVGNSEPSDSVSIDKIGQSFEVKLDVKKQNLITSGINSHQLKENNIGVHISEGSGIYCLTKIINLTPRYIVKNNLESPINILVAGKSESLEIKGNDIAALYEMPKIEDKKISLGFLGDEQHQSAPFSINYVGENYIRVKLLNSETHTLLRVVISSEKASIYITILDAKGLWPYSIRNFSDYEFYFYQANPDVDKQGNVLSDEPFSPIYYKIPPKSAMPYAWDFPAAQVKELVLRHGAHQRYVQLAEIGSLLPMKLSRDVKNAKTVDLNVIADGPVQSLVISNYDANVSMYQLKNNSSTTSVGNKKEEFETELQDENYTTSICFKFEGLGISLINRKSQELCYITLNGAEIRYYESEIYQYVGIKLKWFQVDNQLYPSLYPIIIYPTVVPKSNAEMENHPIFSAAICKMKDTSHGVNYIKFATMLLQELSIDIDEDFLWELLDFSSIPGAAWNSEIEDTLWDKSLEIPEPPTIRSTDDLYFEVLNIQPLQFNLSFVRTAQSSSNSNATKKNAIHVAIDVLTMTIGNINEAPVKLSALFLSNVRTPLPYLMRNISEHYTQAFLYQFYKVLGSADVFGNPVGLFNNISSGVMDIFYEPYQGYLMKEPHEVGYGIAKGGLSFLKKSVFGLSDSVSRFSGSMAKGLTAASLDPKFQEQRRLNRQKNVPKHPMSGFSTGATSFIEGVASGVTGLATAPLEGAAKEGATGFFKGVGKGLLGFPTKTATGLFDFANNVSETIKKTTTAFDTDGLERVRFPRYIPYDGSIVPYSEREARGLFWLKACDGGVNTKDVYLCHVILQGGSNACIVSMSGILVVQISTLTAVWKIPYANIASIRLENTGIKIRTNDSADLERFIPVSEKTERDFLFKNIKIGATNFNKKCVAAL